MKPLRRAFWAYVEERERIRKLRALGAPRPWTDDDLLHGYRWPNVRRCDDEGTKWIVRHVCKRRPNWRHPVEFLFVAFAYRSLNRVRTFERYGLPERGDSKRWLMRIESANAGGESVGSPNHQTFFRRFRVALPRVEFASAFAREVFRCRSGLEAVEILKRGPSAGTLHLGAFFATQIVADLVEFHCGTSFGRDTVVPVSNGSRFGLHLVEGTLTSALLAARFENNSEHSRAARLARVMPTSREEVEALRKLVSEQPRGLGMTFIDVEHSLCEFAKYWSARNGAMPRKLWRFEPGAFS